MPSMRLVFCQAEIMINISSTATRLEKETESPHSLNIHLKLTRSTQTVFFACLSRSHWSWGVLVWMNDMSCAKQVMSPPLGFCGALWWLKADLRMEALSRFIYRPPTAKRRPTSLRGEGPEMDEACGPNFPFSVTFTWSLWPFHNCVGN